MSAPLKDRRKRRGLVIACILTALATHFSVGSTDLRGFLGSLAAVCVDRSATD